MSDDTQVSTSHAHVHVCRASRRTMVCACIGSLLTFLAHPVATPCPIHERLEQMPHLLAHARLLSLLSCRAIGVCTLLRPNSKPPHNGPHGRTPSASKCAHILANARQMNGASPLILLLIFAHSTCEAGARIRRVLSEFAYTRVAIACRASRRLAVQYELVVRGASATALVRSAEDRAP